MHQLDAKIAKQQPKPLIIKEKYEINISLLFYLCVVFI